MRRVGNLPTAHDASAFSDFLHTRGIENNSETDDDGSFAIWVLDDDRIAEAGEQLARYRSAPDSPEFREAGLEAAKLRKAESKADRRRRSTVIDEARVGYERTLTGRGWVSILLVIVTIAVTAYTGFMDGPGSNRKALALLHISQSAFVHGMPGSAAHFLPEVRDGQVWRLITPIFLHGDIMHIVFNMMWLAQLGRFIELRFGSAKLLALILAVGVGSNLAEYWWKGPYFGGMSGVNYGLFGFLWMMGKFGRDQTWQLNPQTVQLMLMWMVLCFTGMLGPIANGAHVGGLVIGALLGIISARVVPWLERDFRTGKS